MKRLILLSKAKEVNKQSIKHARKSKKKEIRYAGRKGRRNERKEKEGNAMKKRRDGEVLRYGDET